MVYTCFYLSVFVGFWFFLKKMFFFFFVDLWCKVVLYGGSGYVVGGGYLPDAFARVVYAESRPRRRPRRREPGRGGEVDPPRCGEEGEGRQGDCVCVRKAGLRFADQRRVGLRRAVAEIGESGGRPTLTPGSERFRRFRWSS